MLTQLEQDQLTILLEKLQENQTTIQIQRPPRREREIPSEGIPVTNQGGITIKFG